MITMDKRVFAHVPYSFLQKNLPLVLERRVNPEVHISGEGFDSLNPEELKRIAAALEENGLSTTMHAPYVDLNPGSTERLVHEATLRRFHQTLDAAEILRPKVIVLHPGYDRWRYGDNKDLWLKQSIDTWQEVLGRAAGIGCILAVENIFEEEPSTLKALFEAVDSPFLRHCFDTGHWNLFVKISMDEWFAEIGSYIAEVHIHDNFGIKDDHNAIGEGNINFDLFFRLLQRYAPDAAWTLEAHSKETLEKALVNIGKYIK
ncbi:MAG: sugar phosphate isomerase/epimerase family protein [Geobacteraceae bacterium]|jgi:sugar phosphate isomerase/epimerase